MTNYEILYYPKFEPPDIWLRSFLLFFDTIKTIIPDKVKNPFSLNTSHFLDELPHTLERLSPKKEEINLDEINIERLRCAFEIIKNETPFIDNDIQFIFTPEGLQFGGNYISIHNDKFHKKIFDLLEEFNFILPDSEKIINHLEDGGIEYPDIRNARIVNKRAGHLILSLLADKIGRNFGLNTITDEKIDFTVNRLNSLNFQYKNNGKAHLISSLIRCEVPQDIQKLKIDEYKLIREKYVDIKEGFHDTITDLNLRFNIDQIEDPIVLERKVHEITLDFNKKFEEFKKNETGRKIKKWTPIFLSSLGTFGGVLSNDWKMAALCGAVTVTSAVIPSIYPIEESQREKFQRLLGNMQKDILEPILIRKLYSTSDTH